MYKLNNYVAFRLIKINESLFNNSNAWSTEAVTDKPFMSGLFYEPADIKPDR